ncbi:hypothetical protein D9619_000027 [Psilocybe cf. subviscida]|uniref:Uncharacterized protein n=1 Tax=Psilocybe cf. subviscida TaxID=2480587 RepID=A0A8H5BC92_9AGAR|nr:hypothetical protein D9619_000027 [Psilocybe cf. subviscida]
MSTCTTTGNGASMDEGMLSDVVPSRAGCAMFLEQRTICPSQMSSEAVEGEGKQEKCRLPTKRNETDKGKGTTAHATASLRGRELLKDGEAGPTGDD